MWRVMLIVKTILNQPFEWVMSKFYKSTLAKIIEKYISHDVINQITKFGNISQLIDPMTLWRAINKANDKEINALMKEIKQLNKNERQEALNLIKNTDERPRFLSSSWVKMGRFIQNSGSIDGTLIIWVKSDNARNQKWYGPYIYPSIQISTWLKMKAATGKNGTTLNPIGAGSVMWHDFLHLWLGSQLRQYIIKNKDKMTEQGLQENIKYVKSLGTKYSNVYKSEKVGSDKWLKANQAYYSESRIYKSQILKNKASFKAQNTAIMTTSKQKLNQQLAGAQNSLYRFNKAVNQAKGNLQKMKSAINVERQLIKQTRKASKIITKGLVK